MLIRIERARHLPECTLGALVVDGIPLCVTREDPVRPDGVFIPGESALPPGLYNLTIERSRRFVLDLPLICSTVTQRGPERRQSTCRIGMFFHPGEPEDDFGGEILLGMDLQGIAVRRSDYAFRALSAIIAGAMDRGEAIEVEINSAKVEPD